MFIPLMLSSLIGLTAVQPVKVATCEVSTPVTAQENDGSPITFGGFALHVRFSNASEQPISRVIFTLNDGTRVSDVGIFSPGITINHALGLKSTSAASCSVTAVDFSDGTTWAAN
jgi:hypothetical protein